MPELDRFTRAYIECALWAEMDNANEQGGEPLDANYNIADIAEETLASIIEDCTAFQKSFADLLDKATHKRADYNSELAGHDFWLTRNGHGAGFWDRGLGKVGDQLAEMARAFGSVDLYVGDDGKIYS